MTAPRTARHETGATVCAYAWGAVHVDFYLLTYLCVEDPVECWQVYINCHPPGHAPPGGGGGGGGGRAPRLIGPRDSSAPPPVNPSRRGSAFSYVYLCSVWLTRRCSRRRRYSMTNLHNVRSPSIVYHVCAGLGMRNRPSRLTLTLTSVPESDVRGLLAKPNKGRAVSLHMCLCRV